MKAFVINVIGDIGLMFAAILLIKEIGVSDYGSVFETAPDAFTTNEWTIVAICLLLMRRRLRQVRAGPAPHLARRRDGGPDAGQRPDPRRDDGHRRRLPDRPLLPALRPWPRPPPTSRAFVGLVTLLMAATIALVVTDLKRIIAFSTMSQIGYMIVGVSIGAYSAGLFHLMTHAFFKALLFMAAGSVIAAMAAIQDIDRMRGFRRAMPFTCGGADRSAPSRSPASRAPPASSARTRSSPSPRPAAACTGSSPIGGYLGAILTAFYSFRIVFRVVYGEPVRGGEGARAGPHRTTASR